MTPQTIPKWKRLPEVWEDPGIAPPDNCIAEYASYYEGPEGAEVTTTFWVAFTPAEEVNFPLDGSDELPEWEGERGLFSVEEMDVFRASNDPDGDHDNFEYGEGSALWYWTLKSAKDEAQRLASMDWSGSISWDGAPLD